MAGADLELKSCEVNEDADSKENCCQLGVHMLLLLYNMSFGLSNTLAYGCSSTTFSDGIPCGLEAETSLASSCCYERMYSSSCVPDNIACERQRAALNDLALSAAKAAVEL